MRFFLPNLLRILAPWACVVCRSALDSLSDPGFCGTCWLQLPRIQGLICRRCGVPLPDGGRYCFACWRRNGPSLLIRGALHYEGTVRLAVHRFKYAGRKTLARPLVQLLENSMPSYPELFPVDLLTAVPLHPRGLRERGYNQSALLAQGLGERMRLPVQSDLLLRVRRTLPQVRLPRQERLRNVHRAFGLNPRRVALDRLQILLIDDVCTSGATLEACAQILRQAGAKSVKAFVLARDV